MEMGGSCVPTAILPEDRVVAGVISASRATGWPLDSVLAIAPGPEEPIANPTMETGPADDVTTAWVAIGSAELAITMADE